MDDKHPRGGSQTASVSLSGLRETAPQVTAVVTTKLAGGQPALWCGPLQVSPCPPRAAAEGTVKMHGEQWGRKVTNPCCQLGCRTASGASLNPSQGFGKPLRGCTSLWKWYHLFNRHLCSPYCEAGPGLSAGNENQTKSLTLRGLSVWVGETGLQMLHGVQQGQSRAKPDRAA